MNFIARAPFYLERVKRLKPLVYGIPCRVRRVCEICFWKNAFYVRSIAQLTLRVSLLNAMTSSCADTDIYSKFYVITEH